MGLGRVDAIRSCFLLPPLSFKSLKLDKRAVDLGVFFSLLRVQSIHHTIQGLCPENDFCSSALGQASLSTGQKQVADLASWHGHQATLQTSPAPALGK